MARGLTWMVLLALLLGIVAGLACHALVTDPATLADITSGLSLVTTIFLRGIRMIIAPLVFSTLMTGIARMGEGSAVGRVALKAMIWFVLASVISILSALLVVDALKPGVGLHLHAVAVVGAVKPSRPRASSPKWCRLDRRRDGQQRHPADCGLRAGGGHRAGAYRPKSRAADHIG